MAGLGISCGKTVNLEKPGNSFHGQVGGSPLAGAIIIFLPGAIIKISPMNIFPRCTRAHDFYNIRALNYRELVLINSEEVFLSVGGIQFLLIRYQLIVSFTCLQR